MPPPPACTPALTTTHKHTHIAGSVLTTTGSHAASPSFRNTADVIQSRSFSLTIPSHCSPTHTSNTHAKKKGAPQSPSYAKTLFVFRKCFVWRYHTSQEHRLYTLMMTLYEYPGLAFVFLPSNLLLWVWALGFYHSKVNSVSSKFFTSQEGAFALVFKSHHFPKEAVATRLV